MGQLVLLLVVIAIGAVGWFIGKLMDGRAAAVTGVICWCVTLATCSYAETLHEWEPLLPMAGSFLFGLLGLGLFAAAMTERDPGEPQYAPLSEEDAKAAERIAARMERLRALEQSVPDYAQTQFEHTKSGQTQSDQTPPPRESDPPTPPT
jgi:hypothetical protein